MTDIIISTNKKYTDLKNLLREIDQNTIEDYRLIATCQPLSAAQNRNYGLSFANTDIIVMLDDDIIKLYPGWLGDLIRPMKEDENIIITSGRLLNPDGSISNNMGMHPCQADPYTEIKETFNINGIKYKRVTTAAIAFKKNTIRFDENFKGSGYEDTDYMNQLSETFNNYKFIVNNNCLLTHINEMKNQGGETWQHNHDYYCNKYPWDTIAKNQKDWTS